MLVKCKCLYMQVDNIGADERLATYDEHLIQQEIVFLSL